MRLLLAACVFGLLFLPGCTSDPAPDSDPDDPSPVDEAGLAFDFPRCYDQTGQFPAAMAQMEGQVPAPLEPAARDAEGLVTTEFVVAVHCDAANWTDDATILVSGVRVEPPVFWNSEGIEANILVFGLMTDNPDVAAAFRAWGQQDVELSEISFEVDPGPPRFGRAGPGGESFDVYAASPEESWGQENVRFFLLNGTELVGATDWDIGAGLQSRGVAKLDEEKLGEGGHFWGDERYYRIEERTIASLEI